MSGNLKKVVTWLLTAVTITSPLAQSLTAAYSADDDSGGNAYVTDGGSVSGNQTEFGNGNAVSGGDAGGHLTVSGSDVQYVLDGYFTGETYVAIRGKGASAVERMRTGDAVSMDLAWDIDMDALDQEGIAEFTYGLPAGVTWAQSEGNIGNGSYKLTDGSLSVFYDLAQAQGHVNAHLYVSGNADTYALRGSEGDILFPDSSIYASYDKEKRLAVIAAEWAGKGLLPYENWLYGEEACNDNIPFDRAVMNYYSAEEAAALDARLGTAKGDTYFRYTDNLQDVIRMAEDGMDLDRFFYGNVLFGLSLDDLYRLEDEDISLAEAVDLLISSMSMTVYGERAGGTMYVANMSTYTNALGVVPQLGGVKSHGPMWQILTSQGQIARCLLYGGSLSRGDTFHEVPYTMITDLSGFPISQTKYNALMAVAEQHDCVGGSPFDIQISQIITWYILANNVNPNMNGEEMYHLVKMLYMRCFGVSAGEAANNPLLYGNNGVLHAWVLGWLQRYRSNEGLSYDTVYAPVRRTVALTFWAADAGGNKQPLMTWISIPSVVDVKYGYLTVYKTDDQNNTLAGCKFILYDAMGNAMATFTSTNKPIKIRLKVGVYYVKETEAPVGYDVDKTMHQVTITENYTQTAPFNLSVVNKRKTPEVSLNKYEYGTNVRVQGTALLQVLRKSDGAVMAEEWVGEGGAKKITLDPGQYILHEKTPPAGYLKTEDVEFTVPDSVPSTTVVDMYDKYTTVQILKLDQETEEPVIGAHLQLYKMNEDGSRGKLIDEWDTDGTPHTIKAADIGYCILYESVVPDGYLRPADQVIEILETDAVQTFTMYNAPRTLSILKIDSVSKQSVEGAHLQIWTSDDPTNKVLGTMLDEWDTTASPYVLKNVKLGTYIVVETVAPPGYALPADNKTVVTFGHVHTDACKSKWIGFHRYDGPGFTCDNCGSWQSESKYYDRCSRCGEERDSGNWNQYCTACGHSNGGNGGGMWNGVEHGEHENCPEACTQTEGGSANQVVYIENSKAQSVDLSVKKVGPSLENAYVTTDLAGVSLEIRDESGKVLYSWVTDGSAYVIKDIAPGTYILHEVSPAPGYVSAADIRFEVQNVSGVQTVTMRDEDTDLKVRKLDEQTSDPLIGATLQIYHANADGSRGAKYGDSFVSGLTDTSFRGIPIGKYILVEEKAPEGYAVSDPVAFEVRDTAEEQTVVMYDKPITVEISKQDITSSAEITGAQLKIWSTNSEGQKDRIYASWTTDGTPYRIEKMPAGSYILEESFASAGYVKAADIPFTVTATGDIQKVTMYDDYTRVEIDKLNNLDAKVPGATMSLVMVDENGIITGTYATWTTGSGTHSLDHVPAGKYLLIEMEAPTGYLVANPVEIEIKETSEIQKFMMRDDFYHIPFTLDKVDAQTGDRISGNAAFDLYEWNESAGKYEISKNFSITRKDDGTYWVTSSYSWAEDGKLYFTPANQGKFFYQERQAPDGYVTDPNPVYINVLDSSILDDEGNYKAHNADPKEFYINNPDVFANEKQFGEVDIYKYDNEAEGDDEDGDRITQGDTTTLDGAVYGIYAAEDILCDGKLLYTANQLIRTATIGYSTATDEKGYLLDKDGGRCIDTGKEPGLIRTPGSTNFQQMEMGKYYVAEITPADGYLMDTDGYRGDGLKKYYVTFTNTDTPGQHVVLRDEEAASDGNNLSIDDAYSSKDIYSGDFVKKQAAQFVKMEDQNTGTEKEPLEAGFKIYRLAELSGVKSGAIAPKGDVWTKNDIQTLKNYDFSGEQTAVLYKRSMDAWSDGDKAWLEETGVPNQYRVKEMWSGKDDGYFVTPQLPYGQYVLIESSTPEGKEQADPIIVTIDKDSAIPQPIRYIGNETLECYLRLVKADAENGQTVLKEGAAYRIRLVSSQEDFDSVFWKIYEDGFIYYWDPMHRTEMGSEEQPFKVQNLYEDGKVVDCYIELPYMLPYGDYELIEVKAPEGYVISGSEQTLKDASSAGNNRYDIADAPEKAVKFSITNSVLSDEGTVVDKYDRVIVTVKQENKQQKGILQVTKVGEQLQNAEITGDVSGSNSNVHTDFTYVLAPVEGAQFEVYAADDIYSQQIDSAVIGAYDSENYLVWNKGDLVGTITTDKSGFACLPDLYLGKYAVKEVVAGDGFILNRFEDEFELTAAESTKNFIVYDSFYENKRQKVKISAEKKDAETDKPLAGAVFALVAKNDIFSYIEKNVSGIKNPAGHCFEYVPGDSRKLVSAGTIIDCAVSDQDGIAIFDADLPLGEYIVKELAAPAGYYVSEEECLIDATYQGQDNETIKLSCEIKDEPFVVAITKYDLTNNKELAGAYLEVRSLDGKVVDSWISTDQPHYVRNLEVGKSYILRETRPVDGYVTAEEVQFTVIDMSKEGTADGIKIQEVKMYDDITKVKISKKDFTTQEELPGAKLQIWTVGENGQKIELIEEWISEKEPHYIEKLPVGEYILVEESAPEGYLLAEEVAFTVQDTGEIQTVEMLDDYTKVEISKKDFTTQEELPGAKLQIWTVDENGQKIELIEEWISEKEPHYIEKLPVGEYILVEESAPEGYLLAEEVAFTVQDTGEIQTVEMLDDYTKVEISKKDITTKEELPGAKLEIWTVDENGNKAELIEEWVSEKEPHYIEKLPVGEYILVEESAPEGYLLAEEVAFTVQDTGKVQLVEMYDEKKPDEPVPTPTPMPTSTPMPDVPEINNPVTGDDSNVAVWCVVAVLAISVFSGCIYCVIKRKKKDGQKA